MLLHGVDTHDTTFLLSGRRSHRMGGVDRQAKRVLRFPISLSQSVPIHCAI